MGGYNIRIVRYGIVVELCGFDLHHFFFLCVCFAEEMSKVTCGCHAMSHVSLVHTTSETYYVLARIVLYATLPK